VNYTKKYMSNYENYSTELKDYILFACPFKIGDRVRIDSLYRGYNSSDEVIHHGYITDILVTTKRQILFRNGLSDLLKILDEKRQQLLMIQLWNLHFFTHIKKKFQG